ncbi:MAG: succinate dehydrogenase, cytochrome b556 subunit [Brachymonas denitrificans]|jgi:succinate dehydrogenase / fumarate reductase cytochrome b subunit|uniref:succinate dehydrogenase, cytochrome b556 subunit n=1 Tax=Brachymonas denitrificans TaxID=28220 RepID=UPI001BD1B680|nr:succinate dehydrogenase, cytochrome b556 subunit [Brachymonas denitrificans]
MTTTSKPSQRPEFRNIGLADITVGYRLPLAGKMSILHRVSGALMFLLLPFVVWLFDNSISSQVSYEKFTALFNGGLGMPGWFYKLIALALIWAFLHHLIMGVRFLIMDVNHELISKQGGRTSAMIVLVLSIALTVVLGAKLFGLY